MDDGGRNVDDGCQVLDDWRGTIEYGKLMMGAGWKTMTDDRSWMIEDVWRIMCDGCCMTYEAWCMKDAVWWMTDDYVLWIMFDGWWMTEMDYGGCLMTDYGQWLIGNGWWILVDVWWRMIDNDWQMADDVWIYDGILNTGEGWRMIDDDCYDVWWMIDDWWWMIDDELWWVMDNW